MAQVSLDILANVEKAVADIQKFRQSTEKELDKLNKATKAIAFIEIGRAAIDAGKAIVSAMSEPIAIASEFDQAVNQLNVSLKLSGEFSKDASENFLNLAQSLQETTTFGDGAVLTAISLAKNLGLTNAQAEKVVKSAADLSAATGTDLQSAVQALTKSYQGQGTQLQRMLPFTRGLTEEQLRAGAAVDLVASKFNGAAQALGGTFQGSLTIAGNAFEDILKTIGQFITQNPIIINGIKQIGEVFKSINTSLTANAGTIREFIGSAIVGLLNGLSTALSVLSAVVRGVGTLITISMDGFRALRDLLATVFAPLLDVGNFIVTGIVQALLLATTTVLELVKSISKIPLIANSFAKVGIDVNNFGNSIDSANKKLFELTSKANVGKIVKDVIKVNDQFTDAFPKGVKAASDSIDALSNNISKFAEKSKKDIGKVAKQASDTISNDVTFKPKLDEAAFRSAIESGMKDIIGGLGIKLKLARIDLSADEAKIVGATAGIVSAVTQGAAGATKLLSGAVSRIADTIIPGIGAVAGQLFEVFAQGPEKVQEFITGFINGIPTIIENVILSIPAVVEALVTNIPRVIDRLISELPRVIQELINKLPQIVVSLATMMPMIATKLALEMPRVAIEFTAQLIRNIPEIVKGFVDEIGKQVKSFGGLFGGGGGGGGGGFLGGIVSGIGDVFGFAEGGIVPQGFPNDTFPAALSSGEAVIDRSVSGRLLNFLDRTELNGQQGGAQNITINLQVGEKQLADVILSLNRNGYRTA